MAPDELRQLEFLCGRFRGRQRSFWFWCPEGEDNGEEHWTRELHTEWICDGYHLQQIGRAGSAPGAYLSIWSYDLATELFRCWQFCPSDGVWMDASAQLWQGAFEGERLVMQLHSRSPAHRLDSGHLPNHKETYEPIDSDTFVLRHSRPARSYDKSVGTVPLPDGTVLAWETVYTRQGDSQ
jgi:hypothetical protein